MKKLTTLTDILCTGRSNKKGTLYRFSHNSVKSQYVFTILLCIAERILIIQNNYLNKMWLLVRLSTAQIRPLANNNVHYKYFFIYLPAFSHLIKKLK